MYLVFSIDNIREPNAEKLSLLFFLFCHCFFSFQLHVLIRRLNQLANKSKLNGTCCN
jgi:hypothetical protein